MKLRIIIMPGFQALHAVQRYKRHFWGKGRWITMRDGLPIDDARRLVESYGPPRIVWESS